MIRRTQALGNWYVSCGDHAVCFSGLRRGQKMSLAIFRECTDAIPDDEVPDHVWAELARRKLMGEL